MTPGDRAVSPDQAAQLVDDLASFQGRDPGLFDYLWPRLMCFNMLRAIHVLKIALTDSPRPYRYHYEIAVWWPADYLRH